MATDPLSLVFIACFLFGLLFFMGTILLGNLGHISHIGAGGHTSAGHVAHMGGHAPSHAVAHSTHSVHSTHGQRTTAVNQQGTQFSILPYLNPTTIALFLLGFGFFGYVSHNTAQLILPLTLVLAALGGLVISVLLLLLVSRLFGNSEGATIQDVSDRTGLLGKVSISIREDNIGEIIYVSPGGMRKSIAARSVNGQSIESGQEVVVVNYQRGGVAEVDTWEHFMHENEEVEPQAQAQVQEQSQKPDADTLAKLRTLLEEPAISNTELVIRNDSQKE